jgi:hypothetical protein
MKEYSGKMKRGELKLPRKPSRKNVDASIEAQRPVKVRPETCGSGYQIYRKPGTE